MQSFLCRLEESALSSGKWMRVDKPFRSPKNMKTYEILMLLILHSILFCITGSSVPVRHRLHDKSYVDCRIQVCRFWPIKIQFNLTVIWANDAPQVWALVADPGGSHCQVHRFQKTDVLRFYIGLDNFIYTYLFTGIDGTWIKKAFISGQGEWIVRRNSYSVKVFLPVTDKDCLALYAWFASGWIVA